MPDAVPFLDVLAGVRELREALLGACARVLDSGEYIGGDECQRFEVAWADYCGVAAAAGVGNGLDALTLGLSAVGVRAGDIVVVPSWTFIATWLAASQVGAKLLPVEVDPTTANLDPQRLAEALDRETRVRAVIPVHLYGQPADMDAILALTTPRHIPVIEDAAQAHGARLDGRMTGALGTAAAFSFYPAKNLGAVGDAGAVVSNDIDLVDRVRRLGNYGSAVKYEHVEIGTNSRLDPLQAAFLSERLSVLDRWNARRIALAELYQTALTDLHWLELPRVIPGAEPTWHLFVVRTDHRDRLREHLSAAGVMTGLHYPVANHRSGAYAGAGFSLPIADRLAARSLSLPIGPHLDDGDAERVIAAVQSFRP